jgi:hypothetical protein
VGEAAPAETTLEAWRRLDSRAERLFPVLYLDWPWRIEPWSREAGMDRAADNQYSTIELAEIKRRWRNCRRPGA